MTMEESLNTTVLDAFMNEADKRIAGAPRSGLYNKGYWIGKVIAYEKAAQIVREQVEELQ